MNCIISPLITEKSSGMASKGVYSFVVSSKANKVEIKKEIERLYKVSVTDVNTMICPRKSIVKYAKKRVMRGGKGCYKKAVATLRPGDVIDFYGN